MSDDIFTPYEMALNELLERLGKGHPQYAEALTLQGRLLESIASARRYGDTETRRAERAQILAALERLAAEALDISFNDLVFAPEPTVVSPPDGILVHPDKMAVSPGAGRVEVLVESTVLAVEPGSSITASIIVSNLGRQVEHFEVAVEGIPPAWVVLPPQPIKLMPGKQGEVSLIIKPPRVPQSRAQEYPITFRVSSQDETAGVEGTLMVEAYSQFSSKLYPQKIRAGQTARLTVENQGNTEETFTLEWEERAAELTFAPSRAQLRVPRGRRASAEFQATPRQRRWIGGARSHAFTAEVTSAQAETQSHPGEVVSRGLIPVWVPPILTCLILVIGALLFFGPRPSPPPTPVSPTLPTAPPTPMPTAVPTPPPTEPTVEEETLAVSGITVAATPSSFTGECPKTFDLVAEIELSGEGTVEYQWERSDGVSTPLERITFDAAGTQTVTDQWQLDDSGQYWGRVRILSPNEMESDKTSFTLTCEPPEYECVDEWGCAVFEPGQTIKIAHVGAMTGPGAAVGTDTNRGAELAVRAHPQVQGFDIQLVTEDTQGTAEQGASVASKLAADPQVVGVVGYTFSGPTEAAMPIYERNGIVMMSPTADNPNLTELDSEVFNRVALHDEMEGELAANYLYTTLDVRNIVVIHDGSLHRQSLGEMTAGSFEGVGGTVLGIVSIEGVTDYGPLLAAVRDEGAELIYFFGDYADAASLVTQMAMAGLEGIDFFGCADTYGEGYLNLTGVASEGTFSTYVPMIPESAAFDQFRADYEAAYGQEPGDLSSFSPHGFDAMAILIRAVEEVAVRHGDQLIVPRKALADTVRATANYSGLTGSITCSATGECAAASILFMVVQNGEWVPGPDQ